MYIVELDEDGKVIPTLEPGSNEQAPIESNEPFPEVRVYINEDRFLKISSNRLLGAVDMCFKFFVLLNIPFPPEVKHIWTFFQDHFYKIQYNKSPYDRVNKLIDEMNEIQIFPQEEVMFENVMGNEVVVLPAIDELQHHSP